jgi:hypothetical protein
MKTLVGTPDPEPDRPARLPQTVIFSSTKTATVVSTSVLAGGGWNAATLNTWTNGAQQQR